MTACCCLVCLLLPRSTRGMSPPLGRIGAMVPVRALLLAVLLLAWWMAAPAAELPWRGKPFQSMANDKPLADFLRELAASQGTTAVIDPKVSGTLSGRFAGSPQKILDTITATYGLSWYYDGAFLFIDPSSEAQSEVMSIAPHTAGVLYATLARLRLVDRRFPLIVSDVDGSVHVTGPRRYVEMVRQAVRLVDRANGRNDVAEIRMFKLKYAWAADTRITRSGKEVSIQGIANLLRRLYGHEPKGAREAGETTLGRRPHTQLAAGADRELRLSSGDTINAPKIELPGTGGTEPTSAAPSFGSGDDLPQFEADPRMNAVLVRDLPERMGQYARLIDSMDVRQRLVEIEVTIMDISTDSLDSLGVDWRAHGNHADFQTGNGANSPLTYGGANSEAGQFGGVGGTNAAGALVTPVGALFTASIGNSLRNYLLARVSALAQKGDANLIARPKVLTLDNNEAVLENLSDFYVRVNGFQDAGLFKVTTGTSVRVTPLIVDEKSAPGVMMSIDIEDGNLSSSNAVDSIPVVLHRTVSTQALIDQDTSLLIAGYSSEEKTKATTGVPVLSEIPVLGNLFKYREDKANKQERFYLLTPRLVAADASAGRPAVLPPRQLPQTAPVPPSTPAGPPAPAVVGMGER